MNSDGKKITELRLAKGWSKSKLARESGISLSQIGLIESGKTRKPHDTTINVLLTVLGQPKPLEPPDPRTPLTLGRVMQWYEGMRPVSQRVFLLGLLLAMDEETREQLLESIHEVKAKVTVPPSGGAAAQTKLEGETIAALRGQHPTSPRRKAAS